MKLQLSGDTMGSRKEVGKMMLKGNREKGRVMTFAVSILLLLPLLPACNNSLPEATSTDVATTQAETRETPVPLRADAQNKGKRCDPAYYTDVPGDVDHNPHCYKLQLKLVEAAKDGDLAKMREALQEGANPQGSVYDFYPPLHTAALAGKTDAVRLLLDNGADVNHVADFQMTPLLAATTEPHIAIVKLLLERGANPCYKVLDTTPGGVIAGDQAQRKGYQEIAAVLKAAEAKQCR
jgi:ankyrin repeat protein